MTAAPQVSTVLAKLRHAYTHLAAGTVKDQKRFAEGLISPAIQALERSDDAAQAAPEPIHGHGYAIVPLIPTPRMVEIGCDNNPTQWNEGTPDGFAADVANDVYVSMVRAAGGVIDSAYAAKEPIVWILKYRTENTPENVSAYLNEKDAQRAASNVRMYAHASEVSVVPAYSLPSTGGGPAA